MNHEIDRLRSLVAPSIQYCLSITTARGGEDMELSEEEYRQALVDPTPFIIRRYRCTVADYLAWIDESGWLRCCHVKKNGKRCRNHVGRVSLELREYTDEQRLGPLCYAHC